MDVLSRGGSVVHQMLGTEEILVTGFINVLQSGQRIAAVNILAHRPNSLVFLAFARKNHHRGNE